MTVTLMALSYFVGRPSEETTSNRAARNERIYQAVRVHEYTLAEIQEFLRLHYSTISAIVKMIAEEKKDQK
jgi:hypothetical protein